MIECTAYDRDGRFFQSFVVLNLEELVSNAPPDGGMVAGTYDFETHYFRAGSVVPYPAKPGDWAEFDFAAGAWFDPRGAADLEAELDGWRRSASLSRSQFFLALNDRGALSLDETVAAAMGQMAGPLSEILVDMTPDQIAQTRVSFAALSVFDRLDPLTLMVASELGVSSVDLDLVFGWLP